MQFCNGTSWQPFGSSGTIPAFHAHRNGVNQSLTTTVETNVNWTTESFDNTGAFDPSTEKFTPLSAGKYLIIYQMSAIDDPSNSNDDAQCTLYKNSTLISYSFTLDQSEDPIANTATCSTIVSLNGSSDFVIAKFRFLTAGSGRLLDGRVGATYMTGVKVSD